MSARWIPADGALQDPPVLNPAVRTGQDDIRASSRIGGKLEMDKALHRLRHKQGYHLASAACGYVAEWLRRWAKRFDALEQRFHI